MSKNLRWRGTIVAILIVIALLYLTPSLTGDLPKWWTGILPQDEIHLGLDLQGGMHLVIEVEVMKAVENDLDRAVGDIKGDLREEKIRYRGLKRDGTKGINVTILREEHKTAFKDLLKSHYSEFDISEGEAVEKGFRYRMIFKKEARDQIIKMANDQVRETITNRIDQFGVAEADIRPMENNRIQIQLPGLKEPERAKKLIQQAAVLEFKLVDSENSIDDALNGNIPSGSEILYMVSSDDAPGDAVLLKKRSVLTGDYITDARVSFREYTETAVSLTFNNQGGRIFKRVTGENINKPLAIIIDNKVHTIATIKSEIGAQVSITGNYTPEEARDLALVLRAGSLPAPIHFEEERTVGPSLGKDSIEKGFNSMIYGGIIVIIFMIIYYGLSGVIADIALLLNVLFIMAGLAAFGATLTLPGIAGIILTIGMAVDANVLIFERIREELKLGKTPRTAIESGYSKAIVTILDANFTTFFAALVLYQFGTGPIKGFAVTLSIGIVASFITAVFVTRVVFDFLYTRLNWKKISI